MHTSRSVRLLRTLGLLPLTAFVFWHLWEHSPIRQGRAGVLARLQWRWLHLPLWLEGLLVLAPLWVHAGLGLYLWRRGAGDDAIAGQAPDASRRNQRGAALLLGAFLVWHVGSLWGSARLGDAGILGAMARAEGQLDTQLGSLAFALGWTAFAVHWGIGLARSLAGPGPHPARSGVVVAWFAAVLTWLWGVNLLAAYVAGASLF